MLIKKRSRSITWAEVSPLPNWSHESLKDAAEQLLNGSKSELFPSIAFGLSCLHRDMSNARPFSLPLAALLSGNAEKIVKQAKEAHDAGFAHAKVKIGSFSPLEALPLVKELLPHFQVRLDINRKWSFEEASLFFSHFSKSTFDYVEEPLSNPHALASFSHPFALDETLRYSPNILNTSLPKLKALILKPTLTGSFETCKNWARFAKKKDLSLVISSAYESGVGTFHLAHFAKELAGTNIPVGLDTYRTFKEDLLKHHLLIKDGRIFIPKKIILDQRYVFESLSACSHH